VDTDRGRPAATVARLLGCTAAAGAKVLKRLQEHGVADVVRKETGSGLNAQSRVCLVPVAEAHGVAVREARQAAKALISDLAGTASGDLESGETGEILVAAGVEGVEQGGMAGSADLAATAQHHALHASGVTPGGSVALSGGFSGEGRGAEGRRPKRACVREDQPADGQAGVAESAPTVAKDGPLRGENPKESPVEERQGRRAGGAVADGRWKAVGWERARQQWRVGLPADLGLRVALGSVSGLWERLSGWQQGQVEAVAQAELTRLAGMLERPEMAPRLLADRLTDRLAETGGEALVDKPYGWLIGRGLVQRQACSDRRCDDGIRLDTGGDCASCAALIADRRAVRAEVRTETAADLPGADAAKLRAACERRLREHTVLEAERTRLRHARAVVEVEARRAAAAQRREREAAAERARRAAPCAECGLPDAAGLCPPCSYARRTELLVQEAVDLAVAVRADLDDVEQVAQLTARCEADTRTLIAEACQRRSGDETWAAYAAQEVAEQVRDERRATALRRLAGSEEAVAEADAAYEAALRRRPRALQAAEAAAEDACRRTVGYLLRSRLGQLQVVRARAAAGRTHHRAA
jgi:hypothetical protein